jgi:hypothetical protein
LGILSDRSGRVLHCSPDLGIRSAKTNQQSAPDNGNEQRFTR